MRFLTDTTKHKVHHAQPADIYLVLGHQNSQDINILPEILQMSMLNKHSTLVLNQSMLQHIMDVKTEIEVPFSILIRSTIPTFASTFRFWNMYEYLRLAWGVLTSTFE